MVKYLKASKLSSMEKKRFTRTDLVSEVTEWMREKIFSGEFPEGESLPSEGELAKQLGVSRNAMREAMRNLRTQGLIEISQGSRPKVMGINSDAVINALNTLLRRGHATPHHLIAVRQPLETEIAAIAAENVSDMHLARLTEILVDLKSTTGGNDSIAADIAFHRYLAEMTDNPIFILIMETIQGILHQSQEIQYQSSALETAIKGHGKIIKAIKSGNAQAARKAMQAHLSDANRDLIQK